MKRVALGALSVAIGVALVLPCVSLAEGPATTPMVIVQEGFEGPGAVYTRQPYTDSTHSGTSYGYWGPITQRRHTGLKSLWCEGTNAAAASGPTYRLDGGGTAVFELSSAVDYYRTDLSFYYLLPSRGSQDSNSFNVASMWSDTPMGSDPLDIWPVVTTWTPKSIELSDPARSRPLSRHSGRVRFTWIPSWNTPQGVGEGPSIDDVSVTGYAYGPVRNLSATSTPSSVTLTWSRPWRSVAGTSTEERPIAYRVYRRDPVGTGTWAEMTSARIENAAATVSYTDTSTASSMSYEYAVQAWEQGAGTGKWGVVTTATVVTRDYLAPLVSVSAPLSGAVLLGTGPHTISGLSTPRDASAITSVDLLIRREDNQYWNGLVFQASPWPLVATGTTSWAYAWTPPTGDYLSHTYTVTASAHDTYGTGTSSPIAVQLDTVPHVAPSLTITLPSSATTLTGTGPFTISGTSGVQSGLPALAQVRLSIRRSDNTYWTGSTWSSSATSITASGSGAWTYSWAAPTAEFGTYTYTVTAGGTDAHGLSAASAPLSLKLDTVPHVAPSFTITSPSSATTLTGTGPFTISGTSGVQSGLPALAQVSLSIKRSDNTYWTGSTWSSSATSITASGSGAWTYSWNAPAEFGIYTYTVTAGGTDAHGLSAASAPLSLKLDTVPHVGPSLTITSPSSATTLTGTGPFTISGTSGVQSGLPALAQVSLSIKRSDNTYWTGSTWSSSATSVTASGSGAWTYSWAAPTAEFGTHTYTVTAGGTDAHGLSAASAPLSLKLDTVPHVAPLVSITVPGSGDVVHGLGPDLLLGSATVQSGLSTPTVTLQLSRNATSGVEFWSGAAWTSTATSITPSGSAAWTYSWQPPANEYRKYDYLLVVAARDSHGLIGSASSTFRIDTTLPNPPDVQVVTPSNGAMVQGTGSTTLGGTAVGKDGATVTSTWLSLARSDGTFWNGLGWASTPTTFLPSGVLPGWSYDWTLPPDEYGAHTYTLRAYAGDDRAQIGTSTPVVFTVDSIPLNPPALSITSPSSATTLTGTGPFTISGTSGAQSGLPALAQVSLSIKRSDNTYWTGSTWSSSATSVTASGSGAWTYSWAAPTAEFGIYTYTVTAGGTDAHGLSAASAPLSVKLDTVPHVAPSFTITSPSSATPLTGAGPFTISGTSGVQSGLPALAQVSLSIRRSDNTYWTGSTWSSSATSVTASGSGAWTYSWNAPADTFADCTVTAGGTDAHGLSAASAPLSLKLDTVPHVAPSLTITSPSSATTLTGTGPFTISGTSGVSAGLPALAQVSLSIRRSDNTYWTGSTWSSSAASVTASGSGAWTYSWAAPTAEFGTYTYTVTAGGTDAHGLSAASAPLSVKLDTVPHVAPSFTITSPSSATPLTGAGPFTISGTSGVQSGLPAIGLVTLSIERSDQTYGHTYWTGSSWSSTPTSVTASGSGAWTYSWNAPQNELSDCTIRAGGTDAHGLSAVSSAVKVTIDTAPLPTSSIALPTNGMVLGGPGPFALSGGASGIPYPSVTIQIVRDDNGQFWNGNAWQGGQFDLPVSGGPIWSYDWIAPANTSMLPCSVYAVSTDGFGHTSPAARGSFVLNTMPGAVSLSIPRVSGKATVRKGTVLVGSVLPQRAVRVRLEVKALVKKKYRSYKILYVNSGTNGSWTIKAKLKKGTFTVRATTVGDGFWQPGASGTRKVVVK